MTFFQEKPILKDDYGKWGVAMMELKQVMIRIPEKMLEDIDTFAASDNRSRDELVCEAMDTYIEDCKHRAMVEGMKRGYEEMAAINLSLAEEGLLSEMNGQSLQ